ncbi:MAG: Mlc titration factor MtfA (ptsG expression regulator) [Crocinitomicaceae bacterium]|jgi:Mlc titration factor MtfA (ptsG expression regulator)
MDNLVYFILFGVAIAVLIGYSKLRTKNQTYKREPKRDFPKEWRQLLSEHIAFYNRLNTAKKTEFEKRVHVFLLNVEIVGVGTDVTHLDRILVASGAVIPIFGFSNWHYVNLHEVQIYPDKFSVPGMKDKAKGLVGWGAMEGKMMLSRKALQHGFHNQEDQINVAIHEFVHVLDKQDGTMDGILDKVMDDVNIMPWLHVINLKIDDIRKGNSTIREYGATNNVEFLAVVSEFFFESPEKLKSEHPALYLALDNFFNQKTIPRAESSRKKSGGYNKGR